MQAEKQKLEKAKDKRGSLPTDIISYIPVISFKLFDIYSNPTHLTEFLNI